MGFGLMFMRVSDPEVVDADRVGLAEFLAAEGLSSSAETGELVRVSDGEALTFDGEWTDLHLDSLTQAEPVSGGIDHATLTEEEVTFIFGLCSAGKLMIINPQGEPMYIVPAGTHDRGDLPDPEATVWAHTPEELAHALGSSFGDFATFRDRALGLSDPGAAEGQA
mgnify:FL=1